MNRNVFYSNGAFTAETLAKLNKPGRDHYAFGSEHETIDPVTGILRRVVIVAELGLDAHGFATHG